MNDHNVFIEPKTRIQYLGATLSSDRQVLPEVTRRIGIADNSFKQLQRVWNHANITKQRKLQIYNACVVPKLMYALQTCWLNKAELRRLDAFYFRCLRRIWKIPHSYFSCISNHEVGVRSNTSPLSLQLLKHQLMLYGRISRLHPTHILRVRCLCVDLPSPMHVAKRGRGRPRSQWTDYVFNHVMHATNGMRTFEHVCASDPIYWTCRVQSYVNNIASADID